METHSDLKLLEARGYDCSSCADVITARRWFARLMVIAMSGCALWDVFNGFL